VSAPAAFVPGPLKTGAERFGAFAEEAEVGLELFEQPASSTAAVARIPAIFKVLGINSSLFVLFIIITCHKFPIKVRRSPLFGKRFMLYYFSFIAGR
jgi:hypothetical protein